MNQELKEFFDISRPMFLSAKCEEQRRKIVKQFEDEIGTDEQLRLASKDEPLTITVQIEGVEENGSYEVQLQLLRDTV